MYQLSIFLWINAGYYCITCYYLDALSLHVKFMKYGDSNFL